VGFRGGEADPSPRHQHFAGRHNLGRVPAASPGHPRRSAPSRFLATVRNQGPFEPADAWADVQNYNPAHQLRESTATSWPQWLFRPCSCRTASASTNDLTIRCRAFRYDQAVAERRQEATSAPARRLRGWASERRTARNGRSGGGPTGCTTRQLISNGGSPGYLGERASNGPSRPTTADAQGQARGFPDPGPHRFSCLPPLPLRPAAARLTPAQLPGAGDPSPSKARGQAPPFLPASQFRECYGLKLRSAAELFRTRASSTPRSQVPCQSARSGEMREGGWFVGLPNLRASALGPTLGTQAWDSQNAAVPARSDTLLTAVFGQVPGNRGPWANQLRRLDPAGERRAVPPRFNVADESSVSPDYDGLQEPRVSLSRPPLEEFYGRASATPSPRRPTKPAEAGRQRPSVRIRSVPVHGPPVKKKRGTEPCWIQRQPARGDHLHLSACRTTSPPAP